MSTAVSVLISCAGRGSRLGLGTTKALAMVCGRPLIAWHLDLLKQVEDLRIIVGFDAPRLIDEVLKVRRDAIFVFNHDYLTTGTAASISAALVGLDPEAEVVSLDGDLLVDPADLAGVLRGTGPIIGVVEPSTTDPVYALADSTQTLVTAFDRQAREGLNHEWSGLFRLSSRELRESVEAGEGRGHVFEMLRRHLPLPLRRINAAEIDTPDDFRKAEIWLSARMSQWRMPS